MEKKLKYMPHGPWEDARTAAAAFIRTYDTYGEGKSVFYDIINSLFKVHYIERLDEGQATLLTVELNKRAELRRQ